MKNILLMTSCITPPANIKNLVRKDPLTRINDYLSALEYYAAVSDAAIDKIVFIDNSNSDLTSLKNKAATLNKENLFEFVSFYGLDYPFEYGIGYGEMKLLDYAYNNSEAIINAGENDRIWKVTGRYIISNLVDFVRKTHFEFDIYCDLKKYPGPWMDMRFWAFSKKGYFDVLYGKYHSLREDIIKQPAEGHIYNEIIAAIGKKDLIVVPRLKIHPYVKGISAYGNMDFMKGKKLVTWYLRAIMRKVIPGLWI